MPSGAASGFARVELLRKKAGQTEVVGLLVKHWQQI